MVNKYSNYNMKRKINTSEIYSFNNKSIQPNKNSNISNNSNFKNLNLKDEFLNIKDSINKKNKLFNLNVPNAIIDLSTTNCSYNNDVSRISCQVNNNTKNNTIKVLTGNCSFSNLNSKKFNESVIDKDNYPDRDYSNDPRNTYYSRLMGSLHIEDKQIIPVKTKKKNEEK